jgi:hypothetical protein
MLHIIDVGELGLGHCTVDCCYIWGFSWSWDPPWSSCWSGYSHPQGIPDILYRQLIRYQQVNESSGIKSQYASDILFIAVVYLAKISATRTIWSMAPRERQRLILITEAFISAWALVSILVTVFQCSLPKPWDYIYGICFNRVSGTITSSV